MITFTLPVLAKYRNSGNATISERQHYALYSGYVRGRLYDEIAIVVKETGEVLYKIPARYRNLFKVGGTFDARFMLCNYKDAAQFATYRAAELKKATSVPEVLKSMTSVQTLSKYMTQPEITKLYNLPSGFTVVLKDFGLLEIDHKEGKVEFYRRLDVEKLAENPLFKTYLANVAKRGRKGSK